jgi:hypothetical protein
MRPKRAYRRLKKIKNGIIRIIWAPISVILLWLATIVWDEISSRYVGSPIVIAAEKTNNLILPIVGNWIFNHPELSAFIFMCLVISFVVVLAYWTTRDPKDIYTSKDTKRNDGVSIHNDSGDDLINCTLYLTGINNLKVDPEVEVGYELSGGPVNIENGKKWTWHLKRVGGIIAKSNPRKRNFYELEFRFHSNTISRKTITMPVFADIRLLEENSERIILVEKFGK